MSNKSESETNTSTSCANCGKEEDDNIKLKTCTACKLVKYCNRECQIAHRPQHKKECKKKAKEFHEIELFKQPPPLEDCPICMTRLPTLESGRTYVACCGKSICTGCVYAFQSRAFKARKDQLCPFCRTPPPNSDEEEIKRLEKRIELNDAEAIYQLGIYYAEGMYELPRDISKALELWHRAGELGCANAYYNIAHAYKNGDGVERNEKKAKHYWELAAIGSSIESRTNLGVIEGQATYMNLGAMEADLGYFDRALKHFMIAVRGGDAKSLKNIKAFYSQGLATKEDYTKAQQAYQAYLDEIKTDQRDEAAAFSEEMQYYESV